MEHMPGVSQLDRGASESAPSTPKRSTMVGKPNVMIVLADDLGWRDLSCYGSEFYETPVLDRLAAEGLLFTDAYAAAPVCSPTRASLLTGKYPTRVGITQHTGGHNVGRLCDVPYFSFLPAQEYSLARAFRASGYQTWPSESGISARGIPGRTGTVLT